MLCLLSHSLIAMDEELRRRALPGSAADVPVLNGNQLADEVARIRGTALARRPWPNRHPYLLAGCASCLASLLFPLAAWLSQDDPQRPTQFSPGTQIPGEYFCPGGQA
jgi:hypothetical protein